MIYHGTKDLSDLTGDIKQTLARLTPVRNEFDFLAVAGMSGVIVGTPVSLILHAPLVIVRKEGDRSHSPGRFINEHEAMCKRYLFLDDFIATGATFTRVEEMLEEFCEAACAGSYMYCDNDLVINGEYRDV